MNASDRRLFVTLRLTREEKTLLRSVDTTEPPRLAPPPFQRFPLPSQLETIARTLDEGSAEDVTRLLTSDAAMLGRVLFEMLFISEPEFTTLLRDLTGDAQPDLRYRSLRVRIVTADPLFAGLPYRFTTYQGQLLAASGSTFEVTHPAALGPPPARTWNYSFIESPGTGVPERLPSPMLWRPASTALRDVRFPARSRPARVLIVAPELSPEQISTTNAANVPQFDPRDHSRRLRNILATLGYAADDPAYMRIVHTAEDFCRSLAGLSPDIVFVSTYVSSAGDDAALWLEARDGTPSPCRLVDLSQWLQAHPPLVLAVAGCPLDGCAFALQFEKLTPWAASTILYRLGSWNEANVMGAFFDVLRLMLGATADPIKAMHAQSVPATLTVHGAYSRWVVDEPAKPTSKFALILRDALAAARETILERVTALARDPHARVLALIFRAPPRSLDRNGTRPLLDELDIAGRHLGRLKVITMPDVPADKRDADPIADFKRTLLVALDVHTGTIEEALLRAALDSGWSNVSGTRPERGPERYPEDRATISDRAGERGLLWVDHGIRGESPYRTFTMDELEAFLEVTAEALALHTPPELRMICAIAVENTPEEWEQIEEMVTERKTQWPVKAPVFDVMVVPAARAFDRDGVEGCFAEAYPEPCPAVLLERMTDAAFASAGGDVNETLAMVTQALTTSWMSVLRGLEGNG